MKECRKYQFQVKPRWCPFWDIPLHKCREPSIHKPLPVSKRDWYTLTSWIFYKISVLASHLMGKDLTQSHTLVDVPTTIPDPSSFVDVDGTTFFVLLPPPPLSSRRYQTKYRWCITEWDSFDSCWWLLAILGSLERMIIFKGHLVEGLKSFTWIYLILTYIANCNHSPIEIFPD